MQWMLRGFLPKNFHDANGQRLIKPVWINNVVAIQRGNKFPNRFVIMSGDIDSRVSDPNDFTSDAPGANDNATGMAGTIEVARILTQYQFPNSIIYTGLSGEEQVCMEELDWQNGQKKRDGRLSVCSTMI